MINAKTYISDTPYAIFHNGKIVDTNSLVDTLDFTNESKIRIIHEVDIDTTFSYNLSKDITIEEILLVKGNIKLTLNITSNENVKINYTRIVIDSGTKNQINVNLNLQKNSYINNRSIISFQNEAIVTDDVLVEEGANYENTNVIINGSNKVQDYVANVTLDKPYASSSMRNYAICKDNSTLNVYTNGIIVKNAKATNLSQKTKGLLLSDNSAISANPQLVIDEFDCLASHGAGIGAIDEDELYYLMSRGLTKEDSERLIIGGFINPVLNTIEDELLVKHINSRIRNIL